MKLLLEATFATSLVPCAALESGTEVTAAFDVGQSQSAKGLVEMVSLKTVNPCRHFC